MTAVTIARREMPLDDLVVRVYHLELKECRDVTEFKDAIQLVLRNLDEVMEALGCYRPVDRRILRAVDSLKLKAFHMRNLCTAVPESFEDPEDWRQMAIHVAANYEQFRIEAGMLYQLAVPGLQLWRASGRLVRGLWIEKDTLGIEHRRAIAGSAQCPAAS